MFAIFVGCLFLQVIIAEGEFNCTFDTDICGWTQEQGDHFNWTRHTNNTHTTRTGPGFDHTSGHGYYMYIETSQPRVPGHTARLISPVINITERMCLVFYYHMYGIDIDTLNVYLSRNGSLGSPVWTKRYSQGNAWKRGTVQIAGGSRFSSVTNVVFEAVRGDVVRGDIAIDDVSLQPGTCPSVPSGTVRLISPLNNGVGRLEVHHNGSWGTVCDNGFTDQAAKVACGQLGMTEPWSKPTTITVAPGSGRIWLDDIRCIGNESSLADCDHSPWGSHSCNHSQDVGLDCETEGLNCTFDINICAWTKRSSYTTGQNLFDWTQSSDGVTGNETRPSTDPTSGHGFYMYIDTFANADQQAARMISPNINGSRRACFMFYYHMLGANVSMLSVSYYLISSLEIPIWTKIKSQGNTWKKGMVQIEGGSATEDVTAVVIEAVRGAGFHGTIAIDDVSIAPGTCPRGLNCTFDMNTCGWTQELGDHFDWTRHVGGTTTFGTGPSFDHTSGNGYYMYIETSYPRSPGHTARLISPDIDVTNQMCLVFYYHMYGLHVDTLNVYFSRSGALGCPVWTKHQPQGNVWKRATFQIAGGSAMAGITNIVFEAVRGDNYQGDIAIDDVSLQTGTCPEVPSGTIRLISPRNNGVGRLEVHHNDSWGTVCDNGFTDQAAEVACRQLGMLESWSKATTANVDPGSGRIWLDDVRCTGKETSLAECGHSPWGSHSCSHSQDVGLNCDTEGLNCSFDTDTCGWTQNRRNKFDWLRASGGAAGIETRPDSDHTSGRGFYMYIETSYPDAEEEVAQLLSPTINGSRRACVTFYYHMFGLNVSTLKVYFYQVGSFGKPVWTKFKSQGNTWKKGMVQIAGGSATAQVIRVVFDAARGAGYQGTIATDDVSLSPGTCPTVALNVHLEPNTDVIRVSEGADLTVKCVTSDADTDVFSITWSHNDRESSGGMFIIQKATQSDEGRLTCTAHGGVGTSPGRADSFIVVETGGVTVPVEQRVSDDVTSGTDTIPVIIGVVAVVVIVFLVAVIIYLHQRLRSQSGTTVMSQMMRNTHEVDGMSNPLYANSEAASEKDIDLGNDENIQEQSTKSATWSTEM